MKLTQILYRQHIGRQIRRLWYAQGRRKIVDLKPDRFLQGRNYNVTDATDVLKPHREIIDFSQFDFLSKHPAPLDQTHPDWHDRVCLTHNDSELLTEGLPQAQALTKTVVFDNSMPDGVERLTKELTPEQHEIVKNMVKSSVIFDAQQVKLPIVKDPARPAWVYPRSFGITDLRKISNLSKNILQLCDCLSGPEIANARSVLNNALLSFPYERDFDLIKYSLTMDVVVMSREPLLPATPGGENDERHTKSLPVIEPLHPSIGLTKNNIYKFEDQYPIISGYHQQNMHTIFLYYDKTQTKNLTELEVLETQIFGRALLKAFTAAASTARQRFGRDVLDLPSPVTVQCVHSDGKAFYLSVYQLNTLRVDSDRGMKNFCWVLPKLDLYETGSYVEGIPTLEGYNPRVFETILAFYKNN